jgi:hypothetical protein
MSVVAVIPSAAAPRACPGRTSALSPAPLLAHTVLDARAAGRVDRTIVSTDDGRSPRSRGLGRRGASASGRPRQRSATTEVVLQHALAWLENDSGARDAVVLFEATAPLRSPNRRVAAPDDLTWTPLTVVRDHGYLSREDDRVVRLDPGYQLRQVRRLRWRETGSVYATRAVTRGGERIGRACRSSSRMTWMRSWTHSA